MPVKNVLSFDSSLCTGCRVCEVICSLRHTGTCNPARARLRLLEEEDSGFAFLNVCRRCERAPCLKVCPTNAITRDAESGVCLIDREQCIGCRECIEVCPFGAMFYDPSTGDAISCDLCGGDPACVKFCSIKAITYTPVDAAGSQERYYDRKLREARETPVIKASAFASAFDDQ